MLTERQQAVLDFVRQRQGEAGIPPSIRDIQRHFGFKSTNAAFCHLRALAKRGLIEQLGGKTWGLRAREVQAHLFSVPVYGAIPAGVPTLEEQQAEESIGIDPSFFGVRRQRPEQLWALRVRGDSMVGAHILDGDVVVLERRDPRAGEIVAALVDGTTSTLKRLVQAKGRAVLRAENKRYADIVPQEKWECQGVVVGVIRRR
ncbi:MAG TPA: transcriptional repressor LexA [Opitutaceae bacterium]|jgi:repressor LexA|nr:transcriptional repressor LexA [Opitutaceae bacterium]